MVDPANPLEGLTRRQLQGLHNLLSDVRSSLAVSYTHLRAHETR